MRDCGYVDTFDHELRFKHEKRQVIFLDAFHLAICITIRRECRTIALKAHFETRGIFFVAW